MDGGRRQPGDMLGAWERACGSCLEQRRRWCCFYEVRQGGGGSSGRGMSSWEIPGEARPRSHSGCWQKTTSSFWTHQVGDGPEVGGWNLEAGTHGKHLGLTQIRESQHTDPV